MAGRIARTLGVDPLHWWRLLGVRYALARLLKLILPKSLLGRSILIIVAPVVLAQIIIGYVFWANHWDRVTGRLVGTFVGEIGALVKILHLYPPGEFDDPARIAAHLGMIIEFKAGAALPNPPLRGDNSFTERELGKAMSSQVPWPFVAVLSGPDYREVQIWLQLRGGLLHIEAPRKRIDSSTTTVFTLWMVLSSALLTGVATIFMRNQVRSVRRLAAAAESFGKGHDVPEFKPEGATEVRQAALAFQLMRERIRRHIGQRTEMLAAISHDLRTPLTRMKLQLAMISEVDGIAELRDDVSEMEQMVEGYLAFVRGEGTEKVEDVELRALLENVVSRCRREGGTIELACGESLTLTLRPQAFARCLTNLISNATRYGSRVEVRANRQDDALEITVDDNGPGIPPERRDGVFRAFARLESSRNPQTGGIGLGLTIARDLVRAHGGEILLEDSPLGGLRARIRIPL